MTSDVSAPVINLTAWLSAQRQTENAAFFHFEKVIFEVYV